MRRLPIGCRPRRRPPASALASVNIRTASLGVVVRSAEAGWCFVGFATLLGLVAGGVQALPGAARLQPGLPRGGVRAVRPSASSRRATARRLAVFCFPLGRRPKGRSPAPLPHPPCLQIPVSARTKVVFEAGSNIKSSGCSCHVRDKRRGTRLAVKVM